VAEELPAALAVGVGDGVAFEQDGEVGRAECATCRLDKGEDVICGLWAVGWSAGGGHTFVLSSQRESTRRPCFEGGV
jgi:hypothetical protein